MYFSLFTTINDSTLCNPWKEYNQKRIGFFYLFAAIIVLFN